MKFLVVFIALLLKRQLKLAEGNRISRSFSRWHQLWQRWAGFARLPRVLKYALLVIMPMLLLAYGAYAIQSIAWGLLALVLEIALLLYVLSHIGLESHYRDYRYELQQGDLDNAYRCAGRYLSCVNEVDEHDAKALNEQVVRGFLHRWFKYFFLMVFWYMVAGVAGVLLAWFTVQYANTSQCDERAWRFLHWLEWIPVRLLGLTYGLAGNMGKALPVWQSYLWQKDAHGADILYNVACASLDCPEADTHTDTEFALQQLDQWTQLHLYSVSIWLVMIAMATIGGWML